MADDSWKRLTYDDVCLLPVGYSEIIPPEFLDAYAHLNVMWYTHLFSCALDDVFGRVGMTREYFETTGAGSFALQNFTRYINEVRVGQHVAVRTRMIARSDKRFHMLHFMTNEDTKVLAATMEALGTHVDLRLRRSAPFPPQVAAGFDRVIAEHAALPWPAPLCGAIHV